MRIIKILFICHLAALAFGLGGLLIALPHPELWNANPYAGTVLNFGLHYAGSLHILFGAATLLLFGLLFVGSRKTLIFFAASTIISLSMELLGTTTGFPFGPYAYTDFLGFKILGHVPYAIPLSWFYMGFTSLILANVLISRIRLHRSCLWTLLLGVYFLTVWDLSLDPSMVSNSLPIHFWTWYESGPYFGMPIRNLVGWSLTGLIYMSVSRLLWRHDLDLKHVAVWLPFGVYTANTCFAIILDLSVGLWLPSIMGLVLGLIPASLVFLPSTNKRSPLVTYKHQSIIRRMSQLSIRISSRIIVKHNVTLEVEGQEHIPARGAVLIVARHFHYLYDGCALLSAIARQPHFLVALDWVQQGWLRRLMELACSLADWPIVLRSKQLNKDSITRRSAYSPSEVASYLRNACTDTAQLLRHGEILVIFPEAYPTIDPVTTTKQGPNEFLPFQSGFARLVKLAERDGLTHVAIVPAGLTYSHNGRWHITLRFGQALSRRDFSDTTQLVQAVEQRVRELSQPLPSLPYIYAKEVVH